MMTTGNIQRGRARLANRLQLVLMAVFLLLAVLSSAGVTVTLDEPLHYHYGFFVLEGRTTRIDDSSMPVLALNALPSYIAAFLPKSTLKSILERYFVARLVTIIGASLFAALVFRWARSMYGLIPAGISTLLFIFDPNIIANGQLVTTDIFAVGMFTLCFYLLWKFANSRRPLDGILCATAIGAAQVVKYSAIALAPLALAVLLIHDTEEIRGAFKRGGVAGISRYAAMLGSYFLMTALISVAIINMAFLFNGTFSAFGQYSFRSDLFQGMQRKFASLGSVPVPVPYPYLEGLDWMSHTQQTADRYGNVYLLGHLAKPEGFAGYYFVASTFKEPLATQIILLIAAAAYFANRKRRRGFRQNEVFLLVPAAVFTIYFNFLFNAQTGIRYYLVAFPLLYVFAGSLFQDWSAFPTRAKLSTLVLVLWLAVSVLAYFPYFTPYFSEMAWDKTRTYKFLSDTNLEWGQSQDALKTYLIQHPDAVYSPPAIGPGRLVVSGSDLVGILETPGRYAWLRDNFEPRSTIAFCYFVYEISPDQIRDLCASQGACQ